MLNIKSSYSKEIAFIVSSCDKYYFLWDPFFKSLKKYWPDCPFNLYLITNLQEYNNAKVKTLKIGEDKSFSDNLIKAISMVEENKFILWFEDVFFSGKVLTNEFLELLYNAEKNNCDYLKLSNDMPLSYESSKLTEFTGELPKNIKYRSALGLAFYKRNVLKDLLIPGLNAWELDKSNLSNNLPYKFCALNLKGLNLNYIPYEHLLIKGKWNRSAIKFLKKEGFSNLLDYLENQSIFSNFYIKVYKFRLLILRIFRIYWK